jgi:hypothetical protein
MSVFSFPRLHIKGLIRVDVGTANNDDYSSQQFPLWSPFVGQPVRLADSNSVQPITYGMSDSDWIDWAQKPQMFIQPSPGASLNKAEGPAPAGAIVASIPAEWNYYGSMGFDLGFVRGKQTYDSKVIAVQYPQRTATQPGQDPLVGTVLSFRNRADPQTGRSTGMLIDVNPESVPCSQVFADSLLLQDGDKVLLLGKPSKAVTRWINFQRNTNLGGPNGAGCALQCVVPADQLQGQPILDFFAQGKPLPATFKGIVFRYYVGRSLQEINTYKYSNHEWLKRITELYAQKGPNPTYLEVVGTLAAWHDGEMQSLTAGRLLAPTDNTIPLPAKAKRGGAAFSLAPATFQVNADLRLVSVDFSGTFPDQYQGDYDPFQVGDNPKFDFGEVRLVVRAAGNTLDLGPVAYQDTESGDRKGWVFDFSTQKLSPKELALLADGYFFVTHATLGDLLAEQEYLIASDQSCVFGEQNPTPGSTTNRFMNDGPTEGPATIRVFSKGRELTSAKEGPGVTVWEYDTTPNQVAPPGRQLPGTLAPGQPLVVPCTGKGNRLYTFILPWQPVPPNGNGVNLMTCPMINLRLLPNDTDYSEYYVDPTVSQPVGNAKLTFDVIFREVLRNYYLLYPAMSRIVPLNDPDQWSDPEMARRLMQRTQKDWFARAEYMPRTRDLSDSRRRLLHAWCLRYLAGQS